MVEFSAAATVPADHPCLAGHFPGRPVVPAVLLLQLAAEALQRELGGIAVRGVPSAKFLQPVLPQQPMQLRLRADTARGRASFRCEAGGSLVAQGELAFAAVDAAP
jgi:3-hydroxyacyl-[acyl-carrier-protein] dehydratase